MCNIDADRFEMIDISRSEHVITNRKMDYKSFIRYIITLATIDARAPSRAAATA
jgi:hypothetical protein